jgi:DNA-directed RNA polymerase sigma subunit (sigma70/sigma32)
VIECKDILSLCDRFEGYLMPLDVYILRQRYNGQTLKSTYTVAKDMGISDETVRRIENQALEALAHCRDLEGPRPGDRRHAPGKGH